MKKCPSKKQISLLVGVFLLILTSCGVRPPPAPETSTGGAIVISTFTPAPTNSPLPPETAGSTLALTSTPAIIGRIPGLSPMNVSVSLEQREFTCTAVKKGAVYYDRTCTKGLPSTNLFHVLISGRELFIVDFIEASVRQNENPDNNVSTEFMSFMATMPYDGATPEDARAWVESTIPNLSGNPNDAQEMVFGGVKYKLYGPLTALTLEMGELP